MLKNGFSAKYVSPDISRRQIIRVNDSEAANASLCQLIDYIAPQGPGTQNQCVFMLAFRNFGSSVKYVGNVDSV